MRCCGPYLPFSYPTVHSPGTRCRRRDPRSAAREVLLDFARAVAGAEDGAEMIDVLASVDEYVDRVLKES